LAKTVDANLGKFYWKRWTCG